MSTTAADIARSKYLAPTPTQLEAAQNLVAGFAARWENPDADSLRDLMHPDTQNLIPPMTRPGDREAVVEHFRGILRMLPDMRLDVVRWAPTGDSVMIEWRATATVAGQVLSWTGVDRFGIRGDRMYEGHVYWDTRGLADRMALAVQAAQRAAQTA